MTTGPLFALTSAIDNIIEDAAPAQLGIAEIRDRLLQTEIGQYFGDDTCSTHQRELLMLVIALYLPAAKQAASIADLTAWCDKEAAKAEQDRNRFRALHRRMHLRAVAD